MEKNKAIARRIYVELMSEGSLKVIDEIFAPDFIDHSFASGKEAGLEEVKKAFSELRKAFPDAHADMKDMISEGNKVATRFVLSGTHKGEFIGTQPTGKKISMAVIDILVIKNGLVSERWGVEDNLGLWQQLGITKKAR